MKDVPSERGVLPEMKFGLKYLIYVAIVAACICGLFYIAKKASWGPLAGIAVGMANLYVKYYPNLSKGFRTSYGKDIETPDCKKKGSSQ